MVAFADLSLNFPCLISGLNFVQISNRHLGIKLLANSRSVLYRECTDDCWNGYLPRRLRMGRLKIGKSALFVLLVLFVTLSIDAARAQAHGGM